jgi:hypothetical protein
MYSALDDAALPAPGFPIRRSTGQRLFSTSPWLIAAVHVLLRLLVPRHPPCALTILTVSSFRARRHGRCCTSPRPKARATQIPCFGFVQFSSFAEAVERRISARGPSKLSSDPPAPTLSTRLSATSGTSGRHSGCLPRKEVIQPQLPLRLPCYDFTPITSPTFDGCFPKGLAHRLRVLPAFVV